MKDFVQLCQVGLRVSVQRDESYNQLPLVRRALDCPSNFSAINSIEATNFFSKLSLLLLS